MVRSNKRRFNSSYGLWENRFPMRYGADRIGATVHINRFFRNFLACCYNRGFSHRVFLDKLNKEHNITLSIDRVRELAGVGRYAGQPYKGFVSYEWLYAIAYFCGYDLIEMMSNELQYSEELKDRVLNFWAGSGKGVRAGQPDLTRYSFPEAVNYVVKR